ncbi:MAG: hypothetical protein ACRD1J_11165, partial [Terriglobia bacterium]
RHDSGLDITFSANFWPGTLATGSLIGSPLRTRSNDSDLAFTRTFSPEGLRGENLNRDVRVRTRASAAHQASIVVGSHAK